MAKWLPATAPGASLGPLLRADFAELASLAHPSLAHARAIATDPETGRRFLTRPYLEGCDLVQAMLGREPAEMVPWMLAAARALEVLQRFGIAHRNLKAANLIVPRKALAARQPRCPRVVLCDPAWWPADEAEASRATAADLHALGAVFHRLLTGVDLKADGGPPAPPSRWNPRVPADLDRLVLKLLHRTPSRRYAEAALLVDDLSRLAGGEPASPAEPPDCFLGRVDDLARARSWLEGDQAIQVVAVTGEAGMGKSAFLRRLAIEAEVLGRRTLTVDCYAEASTALGPIRALAEALIPAGSPGRALRSRLRQLFTEAGAGAAGGAPRGARERLLRGCLEVLAVAGPGPTLLLIDDVHLGDPLTIELLAAAARAGVPGRLAFAITFRTESPFRGTLRPLLDVIEKTSPGGQGDRADRALAIELAPLPPETVDLWVRHASGDTEGQGLFSQLNGHPLSLHEALRPGRPGTAADAAPRADLHTLHVAYLAALGSEARQALAALAVLGRPAPADFLGAVLGLPPPRLGPALDDLVREGTLREEEGRYFFRHGSFHAWLHGALAEGERRRLHGRLAAALSHRRDAGVEETARHWMRSDRPARGLQFILDAARQLARGPEPRGAQAFFEAALGLLPPRESLRRARLAEEAAEACGRAGEYGRGAEVLKTLLAGARDPADAGRLHGRIGVFCHRAGEVSEGLFHLRKAARLLAPAGGAPGLRERLRVRSELAEIESNRGNHAEAESLCRQGLAELAGSAASRADPDVRRQEMILLETLAHLHLRRFQYAEARELFASSLRIGEELGATAEKSLILNNLGTLLVQENEFRDAIESYTRAYELSASLGDDASLSVIQSNLAVLHARTGDPDAAGTAVARAARHESLCDSARVRFIRLHSAGLVDLAFGRYASAIDELKSAILLGEELKDQHMTGFDLVFLGECHLFRGETRAARAAFDRALNLGGGAPPLVRSMVAGRVAVLAALRRDAREAEEAIAAARACPATVAYVEAWNRVFLGWAARLAGKRSEAEKALVEASRFFARVRVPAGEVHAATELAALRLDAGEPGPAGEVLHSLRARFHPGQGALRNPMLAARFLIQEARLAVEERDRDLGEAAALLVEAESHLIGRRLRDLESAAAGLKERIRRRSAVEGGTLAAWKTAGSPGAPRAASGAEVLDLLASLRNGLAAAIGRVEEDLGVEPARGLRADLERLEEEVRAARRAIEERRPAGPVFDAGSIRGGSAAARRVVELVLQVAPTSLPVLLSGETGTGKELVARAIHGESPRRAGPLITVNCAAIPEELLEAQLFGYRRGAFSGAEEDREGLLAAARGGTFLFDEVGELPLGLQAKLLRALDQGRVRPLGATEEVELDVRYLFSANRNLRALAEDGRFRRDLFFRVGTFEIAIPPLRERLEDLPPLVEHFRALAGLGEETPAFDEGALRALAAHPWPGNVRELENVVLRLVLTASGPIGAEEVRRLLGKAPAAGVFPREFLRGRPLPELLARLEREYLVELHAEKGGDLEAMASALGITVRALFGRFRRLGLRAREMKKR